MKNATFLFKILLSDLPTHKRKHNEIGTDKTTYNNVWSNRYPLGSLYNSLIETKLFKTPCPPFSLKPNLKL